MRLVVAAACLAASTLAFAGDGPTLAPAPSTPDQVASAFLSKDEAVRAAADKTIAAATPEFLRSVLAELRKTLFEPRNPLRPHLGDEGTSVAEPDLPPPEPTTGKARGVTLEMRFLDASKELLSELGAPFGTPAFAGTPQLAKPGVTYVDPVQVAALLRVAAKNHEALKILTNPRVTVYDGQRATTQVLGKTAYVGDYEIEAGIANPIVKHAVDGIVLDVRPTLSADGKSMRLDLSTKVRRITKPIEAEDVSFPGVEGKVKVQRPEVWTEEWSKSVTLPDGGSVILGGWKSDDPERKDRVTLVLLEATSIDLSAPEVENTGEKPTR